MHKDGICVCWFVSHTFFQVVVKVSNTYPKDMEVPPSGVADMTTLAYLHEPGVLQNLKSRYHLDDIYVSFLYLSVLLVLLDIWTEILLSLTRLTQEIY